MKRTLTILCTFSSIFVLSSCATATGTAVGAGIGYVAGDTQTGALIGGSTGLLMDIF
jgi:hypothetical protein